jgi:putative hydrolase of HD superfamily
MEIIMPKVIHTNFDNVFAMHAHACHSLKHLQRTGWVKRGIAGEEAQDAESVASHSWAVAVLARSLAKDLPNGIDVLKLVDMCLFHDFGEAVIGDITPLCGVSAEEKFKKEDLAVASMAESYQMPQLYRIFVELEQKETVEAKIVKDLDRLDMMMQALHYQMAGALEKANNEFFDRISLDQFSCEVTQQFAKYLFDKKQTIDNE